MEYVTSIERVRLAQVRETALNEGERRGEQKGKLEGKQESHADMLSLLLVKRFGPLPVLMQERIKSASLAQLTAWFSAALDAKALDEVFQDLPH